MVTTRNSPPPTPTPPHAKRQPIRPAQARTAPPPSRHDLCHLPSFLTATPFATSASSNVDCHFVHDGNGCNDGNSELCARYDVHGTDTQSIRMTALWGWAAGGLCFLALYERHEDRNSARTWRDWGHFGQEHDSRRMVLHPTLPRLTPPRPIQPIPIPRTPSSSTSTPPCCLALSGPMHAARSIARRPARAAQRRSGETLDAPGTLGTIAAALHT